MSARRGRLGGQVVAVLADHRSERRHRQPAIVAVRLGVGVDGGVLIRVGDEPVCGKIQNFVFRCSQKHQFLRQNRDVNDGENFPGDYLSAIFDDIQAKELRVLGMGVF